MGNILGSTNSLATPLLTPEADVEAAEPAEEPAEGGSSRRRSRQMISTSSSASPSASSLAEEEEEEEQPSSGGARIQVTCIHSVPGGCNRCLAPPLQPSLAEEEEEEQPGVVLPVRESLPPPKFGHHITVLSIDGGGIRGLIPAVVLEQLELKLKLAEKELYDHEENVRIADYFDVVAGTSTGALITAMLVTPGENDRPKYTAKEIKNFYVENGSKIFPPKSWWWKGPLSMIRTLWGAKYNGTVLQDEIKLQVGDITLDKTLCNIVIPTFDVNRMEPVIFTSYKKPVVYSHSRKRYLVPEVRPRLSDICIGTSAAPTFFPAHNFESFLTDGNKDTDFHLIDGGVAANNPTMAAISRVTREQIMGNKDFHNGSAVDYGKYVVISIGTGSAVNEEGVYTAKGCAKWGALGWAHNWRNGHSPIIDIFSNASAVLVDWHVAMLLHNGDPEGEQNYLRIQAKLKKDMPMDDATPENLKTLVEVGNRLMVETVRRVHLFRERFQEVSRQGAPSNNQELTRLARLLVQERARRIACQRAPDAAAEAEAEETSEEEAEPQAWATMTEDEAEEWATTVAGVEELERLARLFAQELAQRIARQREAAEAEAPAADAAAACAACACPRPNIGL